MPWKTPQHREQAGAIWTKQHEEGQLICATWFHDALLYKEVGPGCALGVLIMHGVVEQGWEPTDVRPGPNGEPPHNWWGIGRESTIQQHWGLNPHEQTTIMLASDNNYKAIHDPHDSMTWERLRKRMLRLGDPDGPPA